LYEDCGLGVPQNEKPSSDPLPFFSFPFLSFPFYKHFFNQSRDDFFSTFQTPMVRYNSEFLKKYKSEKLGVESCGGRDWAPVQGALQMLGAGAMQLQHVSSFHSCGLIVYNNYTTSCCKILKYIFM
jgi:hypothetical protein